VSLSTDDSQERETIDVIPPHHTTDVLPCTDAAPISIRSYSQLINDGSALRAALSTSASVLSRELTKALGSRAGAISAADILNAAADPRVASMLGVRSALDLSIDVRLVAGDRFSACYEAQHKIAWNVSVVVAAALSVSMCVLLYAARAVVRRSRTFRNEVGDDGGTHYVNVHSGETMAAAKEGELPPGSIVVDRESGSARAADRRRCFSVRLRHVPLYSLGSAFTPEDVRARAAAFAPAQLIVTAASSALAALAMVSADEGRFVALLSAAIVVQVAFAAATVWVAPFDVSAAWKAPSVAALLSLSVVSGAVTLGLKAAQKNNSRASSLVISIVPLAIGFPVPTIIFVYWWRGVLRAAAVAQVTGKIDGEIECEAARDDANDEPPGSGDDTNTSTSSSGDDSLVPGAFTRAVLPAPLTSFLDKLASASPPPQSKVSTTSDISPSPQSTFTSKFAALYESQHVKTPGVAVEQKVSVSQSGGSAPDSLNERRIPLTAYLRKLFSTSKPAPAQTRPVKSSEDLPPTSEHTTSVDVPTTNPIFRALPADDAAKMSSLFCLNSSPDLHAPPEALRALGIFKDGRIDSNPLWARRDLSLAEIRAQLREANPRSVL
jgi:hypothetical protein